MENLHNTLMLLHDSLEKLQAILLEEKKQLSQFSINPVSLQLVADHKSRQLATVSYYDEQRQQLDSTLGVKAPYTGGRELEHCWKMIMQMVRDANELNQSSGKLLEKHIKNTTVFCETIKAAKTRGALYGAKGLTSGSRTSGTYNITI